MPMDITISEDIDAEFLECVDEILRNREFQKLVFYRSITILPGCSTA